LVLMNRVNKHNKVNKHGLNQYLQTLSLLIKMRQPFASVLKAESFSSPYASLSHSFRKEKLSVRAESSLFKSYILIFSLQAILLILLLLGPEGRLEAQHHSLYHLK